jgi:peptide/nickel transport system substrate-binding protein
MQRKAMIYITAGTVLSVALAACGGSNNNTGAKNPAAPAASAAAANTGGSPAAGASAAAKPASPTAAAAKIRRGGTLSLASAIDAKTFDPMVSGDTYSGYVISQVFEGLVKYNEDYKPVGWLADSWDISPDNLVYTFHLHRGIKFHDGTDFNAQAMKFSMDRIRNNKASIAYSDCGPDAVAGDDVVDDFTFKVTLTKPYAPFLTNLTSRCGGAVSPTAVQKQGDDDFALHPVGTGPFKFVEWKKDDHFTVTKNENYWKMGADGKPLPYLDKVNWRVMTDGSARLQALLTGELDFTVVDDKDVDSVKANSDMIVQQQPGIGWGGFMVNVSKPPFNNKALAQAVDYAIDKDEVIRVIYKGLRVKALSGPIPPPLKWAVDDNQKYYDYDAAKAKAKLAEGGQPNGFSFTMLADTSSPVTQQTLELYQAQLKKVGIDMKIESGDFNSVVVKRAQGGDFEAAGIVISGGVDPDAYTYSMFNTKSIGAFNIPHLSDPEIDNLTQQGRQETDLDKRAAIYKQVTKLIMDYSPWIMVSYAVDRFTGNKKVQGWYLGLRATAGYSEYWKTSD